MVRCKPVADLFLWAQSWKVGERPSVRARPPSGGLPASAADGRLIGFSLLRACFRSQLVSFVASHAYVCPPFLAHCSVEARDDIVEVTVK